MERANRYLNSFICKCGNISCRNIHVRSFKNKIPKNSDNYIYSTLHHKSFSVFSSRSIVIDKCCGNYLYFHCSKCKEAFSIIQFPYSKSKFIIGFGPGRLTHLEPTECKEVVIIPDFPIALRSFVFLSNQTENESKFEKTIHTLDISIQNLENDESLELLSSEYDEDIMFGKDQPNLVIGKYNEISISSYGQSYTAN